MAESVSIVVPVYNSEKTLPVLVEQLEHVLSGLNMPFEVILVNDGSWDFSGAVAENLAREHSYVVAIGLMRNYGQHNALLCGIRQARHQVVITLDDDLQNPPEEIPALLSKLDQGFDVVYGTPQSQRHGMLRNAASSITKLVLQNVMGAETARGVSAFRAFRTCLRDAFSNYQSPFLSIDVLLTWGTTRFATVPVRQEPRAEGDSNYTLGMLVTHALNMMTGFTVLPLRIASWIGFGLTLFGIAVLIYVVGRFFIQRGSPAGFPFLASIIAIFSGAQLFTLGVMGEYLARIHYRTMARPAYVVRSITGR